MKKQNPDGQKPKKKGCLIGCLILVVAVPVSILIGLAALGMMFSGSMQENVYFGPAYSADEYTLTFDNGDCVYTPDSTHIAMDMDRTIQYYDNLLMAFTTRDLTAAERDSLAASVNGSAVGYVSGGIHMVQVLVDSASLAELEAKSDTLMQQESVMYASSDYPVQIMGAPEASDAYEISDWWIQAIGADAAWEYSDLCQSVQVGVADSGTRADHPGLAGQIISIGPVSGDSSDDHGTHVAGIIGAQDNGSGVRGIAHTARIHCVDLWHEDHLDSFHTMAEYLAAINQMARSGVKAINNSWGCITFSQEGYREAEYRNDNIVKKPADALDYETWIDRRINEDLIPTAEACIAMLAQLTSSGYGDLLIVQAAGNGYYDDFGSIDARNNGFFCGITPSVFENLPEALGAALQAQGITYQDIDEHILIVGAVMDETDENGNYYMSVYSNFGETVDICAPGDGITSTVPAESGLYASFTGTSMATPMVTGSAAYLWSLNPELTAPEVRALLLSCTAVDAVEFTTGEGWRYPMLNLGLAAEQVMADLNG